MSRLCKTSERQATSRFTLPDGMPYTLTMPETSRMLGIGINGCYEAARRGEIPTLRIGRRLVVPTLALMSMLGGVSLPSIDGAGDGDE